MNQEEKFLQFKERISTGEVYDSSDEEMLAFQGELVEKLHELNQTSETPEGLKRREELLRECLGTYGEGLYIVPPIQANWGLKNVHVGKNVVINFNVMFVDDVDITIGDDCMIGPNCCLVTAEHPISPILRKHKYQMNRPVRLENNVWLGAGVIVLPGVTIGENSIIGAGSVVTHDIEANVIAFGTPAKVYRSITKEDDEKYQEIIESLTK
ncbi:MAG: sugar O-acetyltransferase [Solobacterium sp.]|nr:sugar O-acetyltransferase [Solobacterium sp.]